MRFSPWRPVSPCSHRCRVVAGQARNANQPACPRRRQADQRGTLPLELLPRIRRRLGRLTGAIGALAVARRAQRFRAGTVLTSSRTRPMTGVAPGGLSDPILAEPCNLPRAPRARRREDRNRHQQIRSRRNLELRRGLRLRPRGSRAARQTPIRHRPQRWAGFVDQLEFSPAPLRRRRASRVA